MYHVCLNRAAGVYLFLYFFNFFLSNSKTFNFGHTFLWGLQSWNFTHMSKGLIYCVHQIQAARIYLFLYFLLFFCLSNWQRLKTCIYKTVSTYFCWLQPGVCELCSLSAIFILEKHSERSDYYIECSDYYIERSESISSAQITILSARIIIKSSTQIILSNAQNLYRALRWLYQALIERSDSISSALITISSAQIIISSARIIISCARIIIYIVCTDCYIVRTDYYIMHTDYYLMCSDYQFLNVDNTIYL